MTGRLVKFSGFLLLAALLIGLFSFSASARRDGIMVKSIIKSPSKYYNTVVIINGKVARAKAIPEGAQSGYYYLKDAEETTVPVATNQLPPRGSILSVEGTVKFNAEGPYLSEVSRQKAIITSSGRIVSASGIPAIVVILIIFGVLCVVVAVVFVLVMSKKSSETGLDTALDQVYCNSCHSTFSADQNFIVCPNCGSELTPLTGGILPSGQKKIRKKTMELSNAYFEIINGPNKGDTYRLNLASDQLNVGRIDGDNDFAIDDDMISKEHAKVLYEEDVFYIADRGSKNGTFISKKLKDDSHGKEKEARRERMDDGDQIRLGTTKIIFHQDK
ncbi:FHA domain-containing protein [Candidatus Margulisiibacteriota bacterium]